MDKCAAAVIEKHHFLRRECKRFTLAQKQSSIRSSRSDKSVAMEGARYNPALLDLITKTPGAAAVRNLVWALEKSDGDVQAAVLRGLLAKPDVALRDHIANMLPALHEPARAALCREPGLLEPLARAGLASKDASIRHSVVELLDEACQPNSAYILIAAINDAQELLRKRAGKVLCKIIKSCACDPEATAAHLRPAVAAAMSTYRVHQIQEVLQAAILLGFQCPQEVFDQLDSPVSRLAGPLMAAMRDMDSADTAGFLLSCLQYSYLGQSARSFIARCDWRGLAALGRHEHWLSLKPVTESLAGIRNLRAVSDDPQGLIELPADQQGGALRLAMACGIARKFKDTLLTLALSGEPALAQAAMPFVFAQRPDESQMLLMALHSRSKEVQSLAASKIISGAPDSTLTQHLLEVMPQLDESIRGMVGQYVAIGGFDRYWKSYNRLDIDTRQRAGSALLKLDGRLADHLAARLMGRDVSEQHQAVQMVRQLNMVDRFGNILCQLARHANKNVRSAAVAALMLVKTFDARSTLAPACTMKIRAYRPTRWRPWRRRAAIRRSCWTSWTLAISARVPM